MKSYTSITGISIKMEGVAETGWFQFQMKKIYHHVQAWHIHMRTHILQWNVNFLFIDIMLSCIKVHLPTCIYKYKVWLLKLRVGAAVPDLEFSPEVWLLNNKNVHAAFDLGYISLK